MSKDFEKQKKAMGALLSSAAKSGSKVAKSIQDRKKKRESGCCIIADELFHESLEMFKNGVLSWPEMVTDLNKSLMAIKPKQDGSNDGENDGAQDYED